MNDGDKETIEILVIHNEGKVVTYLTSSIKWMAE